VAQGIEQHVEMAVRLRPFDIVGRAQSWRSNANGLLAPRTGIRIGKCQVTYGAKITRA
jgi:hypothetical protein